MPLCIHNYKGRHTLGRTNGIVGPGPPPYKSCPKAPLITQAKAQLSAQLGDGTLPHVRSPIDCGTPGRLLRMIRSERQESRGGSGTSPFHPLGKRSSSRDVQAARRRISMPEDLLAWNQPPSFLVGRSDFKLWPLRVVTTVPKLPAGGWSACSILSLPTFSWSSNDDGIYRREPLYLVVRTKASIAPQSTSRGSQGFETALAHEG
jgi:hypothetical protein